MKKRFLAAIGMSASALRHCPREDRNVALRERGASPLLLLISRKTPAVTGHVQLLRSALVRDEALPATPHRAPAKLVLALQQHDSDQHQDEDAPLEHLV